MDIFGKAASKASAVASQAAATAAQWYRLNTEQHQLAELRAEALRLRAQIGEEMYKLYQAQQLPPSSLDHLFQSIESTMAAIDAQRQRVDELRSQFSRTGNVLPALPVAVIDADMGIQVIDRPLSPPPVPAAATRKLGTPVAPSDVGTSPVASARASTLFSAVPPVVETVTCPRCGNAGPAGKPFCGSCGARLA